MPKTKTEAGNGLHWDSLQETLDSGDTARKGQQQFITPLAYATAFSSILPSVYRAVDLQMGTGNLLLGSGGDDFMGCDIDKGVARRPANAKGNWNAFPADITLFAPILAEIAWQADTFVLNPPFSINWDAKRLEFLGKSKSKEIRESYAVATKKGKINSGVATYLMALEFMTTKGEGYIILSETIARAYFGNPEGFGGDLSARQHIWLWLSIPGSIFQNCNSIDTAVLYFARDHHRDGKIKHRTAKTNTPAGAEAALKDIKTNRYMIRGGIERKFKTDGSMTAWRDWDTARDEYEARHGEKKRQFNIWIDEHQVIHRHLTPFQTLSGRVPQKLVSILHLLEGQTPMALVVQRNTREALQAAVNSDVWLVDPKLPPLVEQSIRLYYAGRAPFYPLSEVQRIGYVDENETLKCRRNLGNSFTGHTAFEAGKSYKIASETVKIGRHKAQTNIDGDDEDILVTGQDLVITVTDESGIKHRFMQFPEMELDLRPDGTEVRPTSHANNLSALIESFEIPEVQDVATIRHEEYRAALARIDELALKWGLVEKGVHIKNFQKDDLARSTLMDGAILAWAAGLGKTWAEIIRPFLMGAKRVLLVAPDTLHQQTKDVALKFFGVEIRDLMSQDDFYDDEILQAAWIDRLNATRSTVVVNARIGAHNVGAAVPRIQAFLDKPCEETWEHVYSIGVNPDHHKIGGITGRAGEEVWGHRTDLATHAQTVNEYPVTLWQCVRAMDPSFQSGKPGGWLRIPGREEVLRILRLTGMVTETHTTNPAPGDGDPQFWITSYTALGMNGADEWEPELVKRNGVQTLEISETITRRRWQTEGWHEEYSAGIGKEICEHGIRCIFTPTLSRLVADLFDCVEVDEGVRLKSTDSYTSTGVRGLNPKTRLVLSATPIKNRLEDIFWLAKWVDGCTNDATARFPYANSSEAKEQFANEHQLKERNLTREAAYYANTGKSRRFEKRSAEICNIHRLWKLLGPIVIRRRKEDVGEDIAPKIFKPLRVKAGSAQQAVYAFHLNNPPEFTRAGEELKKSAVVAVQLNLLRQAALCPDSQNLRDYHNDTKAASWTDFTTKSAAILGALIDPLSRGKQILIASPFQHFNATMFQRLREAGVKACLCDGTVSATKRSDMAGRFKQFHYSVMVAGEKAMGEGNSFEQCNYLFLPSIEWAFDINDQVTDRVHRLTSKEDVYIFGCVTENTVDERLFALYTEKGDSSHLALDGRLFTERIEEVNLAKLLSDAVRDFDPARETIDEHQIEAEWPYLKQKLNIAEQQFREFHPPIASCIGPKRFANSPFNPMVTPQDIKAALEALMSPKRKKKQKPTFVDPDETPESAEIRRLLEKLNSIQMPKE